MKIQIPEGTLQLWWAVNGSKLPTDLMSSEFYEADDLEGALKHANLMEGDWYILKMCWQNGEPETNHYWGLLPYGAYKKVESVFRALDKNRK